MGPPIDLPRGTRLFVLTGAGISAESGIPTFRDANGLWENHRVEEVASPEGWAADAGLVWKFYAARRAQAATVQPNPAHEALAAIERHLGEDLTLCTQNVDPLHEAAGSRRVIHMHGELFKSRCERAADEPGTPGARCAAAPFEDHGVYADPAAIPRCACGGRIRPHIVWFGEMPFAMHAIKRAVQTCDVFLTVGSSGHVYPAAGLVREVTYRQEQGEKVRAIYVGLERPANADAFDDVRLGKAGAILPSLFRLV